MAKLDITEWVDFVRGIANPQTEERLRQQLESASVSTRNRVDTLNRVAALGRSDHDNSAPKHAVRIAKAIASQRRPSPQSAANLSEAQQQSASLLRRLRLAITFDSLLEPAAAGTRNIAGDQRQVVLEAEGYRVDLHLEHELEPSGTVAVGQVTSTREADKAFPRVPILIFAGQDEIDRTVTSQHGEFQFEGLPRQDLDLCVVIGEDFLEMPLVAQHPAGEGACS